MMRVLARFRTKWFRRRQLDARTRASASPAARPARTAPARNAPDPAPRNDAEWARRQGGKDRAAGNACWTYNAFLMRYRLPKTPASLRLWSAYVPSGEQHLPARERAAAVVRGVPRARTPPLSVRRERELRNLGATAEIQDRGVVAFRVTGRVVDQIRVPGGLQAATKYVAAFNATVSQRHVNPADTLPGTWR